MKKERVLYLDLIRIICFLMVTAFHFSDTAKAYAINADVELYQGIVRIVWGPIAVSCFFMVSGASLIYRYGQEEFSLKEFYKKRFFGLYPLFWLAYLFAFLDFFYRAKSMPTAPKINFLLSVIAMDGYFSDWIPTFYLIGEWFLGVIVVLYLLFPLYRVVMRKCKYVLPAVFFIASVVLLYYNPFPIVIEKNPIMCSMYFTLGMMLEMLRENKNQHAARIGRRIGAAIGTVLIIAIYIVERNFYQFHSYPYHVIFVVSVSLYMIVMEVAEWIKSERIKGLIITIGKHSYAYFLLHHVFLYKYMLNFAGATMDSSNTLLLFLSSVFYIYILAVILDKIYAMLIGPFIYKRS
ncbi:MAG: acyltransferase [Butyrivibrio sp.]|nr:acyltransferase [Butyrivibrio sp.]